MRTHSHPWTLFCVLVIYSSGVCAACAVHVVTEAGCRENIAAVAPQAAAATPGSASQHHSKQELCNTERNATVDQGLGSHVCNSSHSMQELHQSLTAHKLAAVKHLTSWLQDNDAEIHVEAREGAPGAGLALFALKDVKQGEVLLSMPTDLGFKQTTSIGVMGFLLDYVLDVYDVNSPRALMWSTAPRPHELHHLLNFPKQYLPLLQNQQLEDWISDGLHHDLQLFYKMHYGILATAGLTYEDVIHAMGLIGTRIFAKPSATDDGPTTFYALPLLDMANHNNSCPHSNQFGPCQFDSSRECVYFTAGADVAANDEVCFYYGYLLPDRALLEYGFLPQQEAYMQSPSVDNAGSPQATELSGIDRHDADVDDQPLMRLYVQPPEFVGKTPVETEARIHALQLRLEQLKKGDKVADHIKEQGPAEWDRDGYLLGQLLSWHKQRQEAILAEITRLHSHLH